MLRSILFAPVLKTSCAARGRASAIFWTRNRNLATIEPPLMSRLIRQVADAYEAIGIWQPFDVVKHGERGVRRNRLCCLSHMSPLPESDALGGEQHPETSHHFLDGNQLQCDPG